MNRVGEGARALTFLEVAVWNSRPAARILPARPVSGPKHAGRLLNSQSIPPRRTLAGLIEDVRCRGHLYPSICQLTELEQVSCTMCVSGLSFIGIANSSGNSPKPSNSPSGLFGQPMGFGYALAFQLFLLAFQFVKLSTPRGNCCQGMNCFASRQI